MESCTYCNHVAECGDHVTTPVRTYNNRSSKEHGKIVPSCVLCNSILRNLSIEDPLTRREFCQERYRHWLKYGTNHILKHGRNSIESRLL